MQTELERQQQHFRKYEVKADNLLDFLDRFYKHDRFRGRGDDYAEACIRSHRADLEKNGFTLLSRHESVTGRMVAYYRKEEKRSAEQMGLFEGVE